MTQTVHAGQRYRFSARQLWALCLALSVVAAVPRLTNLTGLGFHGDEDITAFAVQSAVDSGSPQMPSGMPYLRGLPYTWLTAGAVALLGDGSETAFRLPGAVFGILTVPLLFLLARQLTGTSVALIAALLLALSQWHIYYSQHARMYAAFVFFFAAASFAILSWLRSARWQHLLLALVLGFAATSLHLLGTLLVFAFAAPYLTGTPRVRWPGAAAAGAVVCGLALAYNRFFVTVPYGRWRMARGSLERIDAREPTGAVRNIDAYLPERAQLPIAVLAAVVIAGGVWLLWRITRESDVANELPRRIAVVALGGAAAGFTTIGQLYGAALAVLLMLLVAPDMRGALLGRARPALVALGGAAVVWSLAHVLRWGVYAGVKAAAVWPYALPIHLTRQFVVPMMLFTGATLWLALRPRRADDAGIRTCLLIVWLPVLGLGLITFNHATRYLIELYPFILIVVASATFGVVAAALRGTGRGSERAALFAGLAIAASGVLSGHGVPQAAAVMTAGPGSPPLAAGLPVNPDHRGAARWLAARRSADDIVIAEDQLALRWYGVTVDYWLRRSGDALQYLYRDESGVVRDFYGQSALLADPADADTLLARARGRVWLVTSAETEGLHHWYLSVAQRDWLAEQMRANEPTFVAGDGVTRVYCLNCDG